jgi:hypothetical protein
MPALSLYLSDKTLATVKKKAADSKLPISQIIKTAVEQYLHEEDKREAKDRIMQFLKKKPIGGAKELAKIHKDRTEADDCRG